MTTKFVKDATLFLTWANKIGLCDEGNVENVIGNFQEPAKKKFQCFVKHLKNEGTLTLLSDSNLTEAIETLCTDFYYSKKNGGVYRLMKLNPELQSDNCGYLDTLPCTTEQLVQAFGQPDTTGTDSTEHRYEWHVLSGDNMFTIYDWKASGEWYIGGTVESKYKKDIKNIVKYVAGKNSDSTSETHETVEAGSDYSDSEPSEQCREDMETLDKAIDSLDNLDLEDEPGN